MSSFVVSLVVPVLLALAIRLVPARYCLEFAWVAVVPDLDYFTWNNQIPGVPNLHRGLFHNVLILVALAALTTWAYARVRSRLGGGFSQFLKTRWGAGWALAPFYYFCHITLDLFANGIVPFYPFSTWTIAFNFRIFVDTSTNRPTPDGSVATQPTIPDVSPVFEWLSNEETAIVVLTLVTALLAWLLRRYGRPAVVVRARPLEAADAVETPPPT